MAVYEKGRPVVVKTDAGYINGGLKGVLAADLDTDSDYWAEVEWDAGQAGTPLNGAYVAASFDFPEVEKTKVDFTEAIAALVDKTYAEAYQKGRADEASESKGITNNEREGLRKLFSDLQDLSQTVYERLESLDVI